MAQDKMTRVENRIDTAKYFDELKRALAAFCKVMVESFDLEMCLVQFYKPNPVLPPFVISYPPSEYENTPENEIEEIEFKLIESNKPVVTIPILQNEKWIGALLVLPKKDATSFALILDEFKNSAAKIADAIQKIAGIEAKARMMEFIQKYVSYKKKIGIGQAIDEHIIYKLLSSVFVLTRLYIEIKDKDGSYFFHHIMAGPDGINDCFYGKYESTQFDNLKEMIKNDEHWTLKVDIKEHGQEKGKIFVRYEKSGSFVDEEIERTLLVIGPNLAELVTINYSDNK